MQLVIKVATMRCFVLVLLARAISGVVIPGDERIRSPAAVNFTKLASDTVAKATEASIAAQKAVDQAKFSAADAKSLGDLVPDMVEKADAAVKQAETSWEEAQKAEEQAKALTENVEDQAYEAAKVVAKREVERLKAEAEGHYQAYLADLQLAAVPTVDKTAQAEAVGKAKKPYLAAAQKVEAQIEYYNSLAITVANEAIMYTDKSKKLANMAVNEQALGSATTAAQHMMEAHKLLRVAQEKKARATKIREMVEGMNNNILPSYKQAVEIAGVRALAFSGLQVSQRHHHLRRSEAN
eukprot:TRINITY_DN63430_c0_g1_i1.p1 TRINITY_DN63430_c0_g1~~TRINITY_DN63430_c0_g1_i1.p1  ORF type:complete len:296 (-),score=95.35 TRINITY_DN63430_c0_g1_i1:33-920(-)